MDPFEPQKTNEEQDLFHEMEPVLVPAESGLRLVNLIVDRIAFMAIFFVLGIVLALVAPEKLAAFEHINPIVDFLVTNLLYALCMGAQEALFKGKTLAKLMTGTRAVYNTGGYISTSTAFARGISRIVPFEPFSGLGSSCNPWHDSWNHTIVINEKQSRYFDRQPQY